MKLLALLEEAGIACTVRGTADTLVGFSSIYHYKPHTLTWLRKAETLSEIELSEPIACLITGHNVPDVEQAVCQIRVNDPRAVFFYVVDRLWGKKETATISPLAHVEDGAVIGENASIGAYTTISAETRIGKDCRIGNHVTISGKVTIGDRCVIQSGAVIGEDGFAYTKDENGLTFVKHYGGVTIGDDVAIGAQACVCRGTIDDTVIGNMVKIDNLCHIAHNVVIDERVIVIAGAVVMGSVHIGSDSWIATGMIRDQRTVGKNCVIGMGAVVVKDVPDGMTVAGNPAKPFERKEKI